MPNSAELLSSPRMELLIAEMKNRYRRDRIVIFDSPAMLICTDPLILSRYVDGVLLVVEEEKTTTDDINRLMQLLQNKPVMGMVYNKAKSKT